MVHTPLRLFAVIIITPFQHLTTGVPSLREAVPKITTGTSHWPITCPKGAESTMEEVRYPAAMGSTITSSTSEEEGVRSSHRLLPCGCGEQYRQQEHRLGWAHEDAEVSGTRAHLVRLEQYSLGSSPSCLSDLEPFSLSLLDRSFDLDSLTSFLSLCFLFPYTVPRSTLPITSFIPNGLLAAATLLSVCSYRCVGIRSRRSSAELISQHENKG